MLMATLPLLVEKQNVNKSKDNDNHQYVKGVYSITAVIYHILAKKKGPIAFAGARSSKAVFLAAWTKSGVGH
jgi:hypothetical protein